MASLKDLKNRIASVKATQKITRAMQMVAAAKLRRAQEAAEAGRPYADRFDRVLGNLARALEGNDIGARMLVGTGKEDTHLLVVATAERGLCGGFNSSIVRLAREMAGKLIAEGKTVKILCVGAKGHDALKRQYGRHIEDRISLRHVRRVSFADVDEIAKIVLSRFDAGEYDVCTMFYARFETVMSQVPTALQLIPMSLPQADGDEDARTAQAGPPAAYEYEPEEKEILEDLLPRNVKVQIFRGLLENAASEQGARMSAMDSATRNAGEMIDKLTLSYNRQRQAQITKELIEIISGAEAV